MEESDMTRVLLILGVILLNAGNDISMEEIDMTRVVLILASIVLILHGVVHLMGTTVYLKLGNVEGLPYKTSLLGGRWDVGAVGIGLFGLLWGVVALGFIVSAVAMLIGWEWWQPALIGVTIASLLLTVFDWSSAYAGAILNTLILIALWLGPHLIRR
jgi:hypothetical protein